MPKFRKKPVVLEAVEWTGDPGTQEYPDWLKSAIERSEVSQDGEDMRIVTLEGVMYANPGDYVIQGTAGELYPCKPDIFKNIYDPEPEA